MVRNSCGILVITTLYKTDLGLKNDQVGIIMQASEMGTIRRIGTVNSPVYGLTENPPRMLAT